MKRKDPYSYESLKSRSIDLKRFPQERWHELISCIRPSEAELSISSLSIQLDLYWPKSGRFTFMKISDCLHSTTDSLFETASMGRKKVSTIIRILTYLHENPGRFSQEPEEEATQQAETLSISIRLENEPDEWKSIAISEWDRIRNSIPRKSHQELVARYANDLGIYWPAKSGWERWRIEDCLKDSYYQLVATKNLGKVKLETIVRVLIHLAFSPNQERNVREEEKCSKTDPGKIWEHPVITNLDPREWQVFETRLLTVYDKPSLNIIGQQYGVTRERIRQIENGVLKKIAASGLETELEDILFHFKQHQLLPIFSGKRYLLRNEVLEMINSLDQDVVLAIALGHKSIFHLLSKIAVETPTGWYFGKRSFFYRVTKKLKRELFQFLPAPTSQVSKIFSVENQDLVACCLLGKLAFPCGGLLLPIGSGRADAIRGAQCFKNGISESTRFWSIDDLIEKTAGELQLSDYRIYRRSIARCSRLFLSTPTHVTVLDYSIESEINDSVKEYTQEPECNPQDEELRQENLTVLKKALQEQWPITESKIIDLSQQPEYQTNLSKNSLLPLLNSVSGCIRIAPGVYGPKDYTETPTRLKESRKLILRDSDIRYYCYARRSGENCAELFPLWDSVQEQLWYRKLRKKKEDNSLLRSFVSIADQSHWPEQSPLEELELMELGITAKFCIEPAWIKNRSYNVPDLSTTLTALRYAKEVASLSWIRANHITRSLKLTEESGVSVLICGIVLGLLDSSKRSWWKPIPPAEDFDKNWERIQCLYMEREIPDWSHPVIKSYFNDARELAFQRKLGFIKSDSLDRFTFALKAKRNKPCPNQQNPPVQAKA